MNKIERISHEESVKSKFSLFSIKVFKVQQLNYYLLINNKEMLIIVGEKGKLINITTAIPESYINGIQKLVDIGLFETRSHVIRKAVERALIREEKAFSFFDFKEKNKGEEIIHENNNYQLSEEYN